MAGEQRRRGQPSSPTQAANRPAENWFYQLFTFSTTNPAAAGEDRCFPFQTGVEQPQKDGRAEPLLGNKTSRPPDSIYKCGTISSSWQDKAVPKVSPT